MSRLSLFNSPLLLGFDHFERALDRVSKVSADGYPPYNIEQLGENALRITLAVAGFQLSDLSITIEDNQLVVRGRQTDDTERVYLHRGIAARQFQRSFVLAEGIEVQCHIARQWAAAHRVGPTRSREQGAYRRDKEWLERGQASADRFGLVRRVGAVAIEERVTK